MDAAAYASFLLAMGHRVVSTPSAYWFDASRFFYLSAPSHLTYAPSLDELGVLWRQFPCMGVRFASPLEGPGRLSYQIVCDNPQFGLDSLSGNIRSKVRRGLKRCEVKPMSLREVAVAGMEANVETTARQGREGVLAGERWDRFFAAAERTPGFEAWGAWCGDELAAFLITACFTDSVEFLLARSRSSLLSAYPNNALIYSVTEEMMVRRRISQITFGLESLEPVGPLDEFKFGMGFRARPLRQRVIFHPLIRPLVQSARLRHWLQRWSERRGANAVFWRKAAGILRFADESTEMPS